MNYTFECNTFEKRGHIDQSPLCKERQQRQEAEAALTTLHNALSSVVVAKDNLRLEHDALEMQLSQAKEALAIESSFRQASERQLFDLQESLSLGGSAILAELTKIKDSLVAERALTSNNYLVAQAQVISEHTRAEAFKTAALSLATLLKNHLSEIGDIYSGVEVRELAATLARLDHIPLTSTSLNNLMEALQRGVDSAAVV